MARAMAGGSGGRRGTCRVVTDRTGGKTVMTDQSPFTGREMGTAMADELGGRGARPSPLFRAALKLRARAR